MTLGSIQHRDTNKSTVAAKGPNERKPLRLNFILDLETVLWALNIISVNSLFNKDPSKEWGGALYALPPVVFCPS